MKSKAVFHGRKCLYATGVYLQSCLCVDGKYRWVVIEFNDDTFENGEIFNPEYISSTDVGLLENTKEGDE